MENTEEIQETYIDRETRNYQIYMCRKCKFYSEKKCLKNRIIRDCANKGLKNKN